MKKFRKLLLPTVVLSTLIPTVATQCNQTNTNNGKPEKPQDDRNDKELKDLSAKVIKYARENLLTQKEIVKYQPLLNYLNTQVNKIDALGQEKPINKTKVKAYIIKQENNFKAMNKVFSSGDIFDNALKQAWMHFNNSLDKMVEKSNFIIQNDLKLQESKAKYRNFIQDLTKNFADNRFDFISNTEVENFNSLYNQALLLYKTFMRENLPKNYVVLMNNYVADGDTIYQIYLGEPAQGQDTSVATQPLVVKEAKHKENIGRTLGLRFRGIDTPETFKNIPAKDAKLAPLENKYAHEAKWNLMNILDEENWVFYIHKTGNDVYGRWVTLLFSNSKQDFATEFGARQVAAGMARVWYINDTDKKSIFYAKTPLEKEYYKYIIKVQEQAQAEKKGFWKENINNVFHID
ncbi:thermonuclease family protein [Mycoplasma sp. VS509_3]|uniref:thermonuclease family protein n=1 Tax=unclassified Mycoplasma TaxID=2683645 RepID=UPI003AAF68F3